MKKNRKHAFQDYVKYFYWKENVANISLQLHTNTHYTSKYKTLMPKYLYASYSFDIVTKICIKLFLYMCAELIHLNIESQYFVTYNKVNM